MQVIFVTCLAYVTLMSCVSGREFFFGSFIHSKLPPEITNPFEWSRCAPAIQMAIEDFESRGGLPGHTVRFEAEYKECSTTECLRHIRKWQSEEELVALIGPGCSRNLESLGLFMSLWNIPFISFGAANPMLSDKSTYTTLIRSRPNSSKQILALLTLFREFNWKRALLVSDLDYCANTAEAVAASFPKHGIEITNTIFLPTVGKQLSVEYIDAIITTIKHNSRVILLCLKGERLARFMVQAYDAGLTNGEYAFIYYATGRDLPKRERTTVEERKLIAAMSVIKDFTEAVTETPILQQFYNDIPIRLQQPPWNSNISVVNGIKGSFVALLLYECVYTYLSILNDTLNGPTPEQYKNGSYFLEQTKGKSFPGLENKIQYDDNGDRVGTYTLASKDLQDNILTSFAEVTSSGEVRHLALIDWRTADGLPPLDTPPCGFRNELCPDSNRNIYTVTGSVGSVVVIIMVVTLVLILRHQEKEALLKRMLWKVDFQDVTMFKANMSRRSILSGLSILLDDEMHDIGSLGIYNGKMVTVYRSELSSIKLKRDDHVELNEMKEMRHDNLNKFIGACIDAPDIGHLMAYCPKGSVQDIIHNEEIHLDWMLKMSIISDLIKGMIYIHGSGLGFHGNLKSTCCLVDNQWVVKVSSYGMHSFQRQPTMDELESEEYAANLLWTSPELLRKKGNLENGSPKGDVYSFGVILQELAYRTDPYFMDATSPQEIISQVERQQDPPFRPELPDLTDDTHSDVSDLISRCWAEDPEDRPSFIDINSKLEEMNDGREVDIMEMMIERMEGYAANLEEIVAKRTAELIDEKSRTEALLFQMLPRKVAEKLMSGQRVEPEMFDSVTIYFSDIVGFTSISSGSTALEVVDLLNDLYTLFDGILSQHDVYKVETVGDAYMVVSGLPFRNGDRHAAEIANLSLDLLSAVTYKSRIRHRPDIQMRLRSGFHTGTVAAGVVGVKMPRYCLFGETVLYASEMESSGWASRVQCSEETYDMLKKSSVYHLEKRETGDAQAETERATYWLMGKDDYDLPLPVE